MKTNRTILSLLTELEFDEVLEMFNEPKAFQYIKPLQNKSKEAYIKYLALKIQEIKAGLGYYWVVRCIHSSDFIGAINLTPIPGTDQIQIGWLVKNRFRRQGYAYEAAKAAIEFGVTKFNLIYGVFETGNIASEKILKKLNFVHQKTVIEDSIELHQHIYHANMTQLHKT